MHGSIAKTLEIHGSQNSLLIVPLTKGNRQGGGSMSALTIKNPSVGPLI